MTDLERLWEALSPSDPPTEELLRRARRQRAVRRRRRLLAPLAAATGLAVVAGAFVAGTVTGGSGSGSTHTDSTGGTGPSLAAFQADLPAATSCGQLRTAYVDRGLAQVTAWGWQRWFGVRAATEGTAVPLASDSPSTSRQVASDTGTNVQERGVDEPDTVKSDGSTLVRLRGQVLQVFDLTGTSVRRVGSMRIGQPLHDGELLLHDDTVTVLGTGRAGGDAIAGRTWVITVSIADPSTPTLTGQVGYDSTLLSARQHGGTVRLVLSAGLPDLAFVHPTRHRTQRQALRENRRAVRRSTIGDWLPTYDAGSGTSTLLDCRNVAIPTRRIGLDTVSVVGFDAGQPSSPQAIGIAGSVDIAYESATDLYLAATPTTWWADVAYPGGPGDPVGAMPTGSRTYLFDFALDGVTARHVASGSVPGRLADRWSMDSAEGTLRLAVEPLGALGGSTSILLLHRHGTRLEVTGRLNGLGRSQELTAVRWFDELAIVVTFRQVDPLYAVDLSDPDRPRLLGKLKIPGFSSYLHPLGPDRMIGVGQGGSGAQIALFDVSDLDHVRQLDVHHYPRGSSAVTDTDPRAFTWPPDGRHVLTVIRRHHVGYLSVMWVHGHRLHLRRLQPVAHGHRAIAQVRTIGLPDGRVVLVAGARVRFVDV
ncbi:MAG: beta-propeller domain-containing protein [Nocardioides sp.]|uniref:beta-propeller domain-containing protein n=1 Tax=Nocardioides sp. TaxID=35761 RepID=UPI0039E71F18